MNFFKALFLLLLTSSLSAQLNDKHLFVDAKTNVLESIIINSDHLPSLQNHDYSTTDSISFVSNPVSPGQYQLDYKSAFGYTGDVVTTIEYFESSGSGIPTTNYTTIHFRFKTSKVILEDDYILGDGSPITIDPLLNDSTTDGPLELVKLGHIEGGSATLNPNNTLVFTPSADYGRILYFAKDALGNIESSIIQYSLEDPNLTTTKEVFTDNNGRLDLILTSAVYTVSSPANHGSLTQIGNSHLWQYEPDAGYTGLDNFSFSTTTGGLIEYTAQVLSNQNSNSYLVDDEIYIPTNGSATFDLTSNDLKSAVNIIYHSPELIDQGNGSFSYTADPDFEGDLQFEYKVLSGFNIHTAKVNIHIGRYEPIVESDIYSFDIIEDQSLSVVHNTPISEYYFEVEVDPSFGTLTILSENDEVITECDTLIGNNRLVYTPNAGYTGLDEFDIKYCTTTGVCAGIVKVDVHIQPSSYDECLCLDNCVFQGDHNDDGKVDVLDVLSLGLNTGQGGSSRTNDFTDIWTGQFSSDWGYSQLNSGVDLKCGDSDGDGYIDSQDLALLNTNYGKVSRFQSDLSLTTSDLPIMLIPQQTEVDSGVLLVIDIAVGNSTFAAIDFQGLSFSVNIDAEIMDSASVNFYLYEDNWLSYNNPTLEYAIVPQDGQIDIATSRISRSSTDGYGIIGALEFIVEDELIGFRRSDLQLPGFDINLDQIVSVNALGELLAHPSSSYRINFDKGLANASNTATNSISIYPNPTASSFVVKSSDSEIKQLSLVDLTGRIIKQNRYEDQIEIVYDIYDIVDGIYFIEITTALGTTTEKVEKISAY